MAEGLCCNTNGRNVMGARAGHWGNCVTIQSLYRDKRVVWLRACHDTIDYIVTVGQRLGRWLCRDTDATRPGQALRYSAEARAAQWRYGRPGPQHGQAKPATWPGQACDTAQCARRLGKVCTWCTQPVLDSVHCF